MTSLHCDVVETLRRVVRSTVGSTKFFRESGDSWVPGVLVVRETTPVASVDDKHSARESYQRSAYVSNIKPEDILTVTENEFGNTSQVHANGTEEIVVGAESDKRGRSYSTLETAKNENGRGVRNQETQETEKSWVG